MKVILYLIFLLFTIDTSSIASLSFEEHSDNQPYFTSKSILPFPEFVKKISQESQVKANTFQDVSDLYNEYKFKILKEIKKELLVTCSKVEKDISQLEFSLGYNVMTSSFDVDDLLTFNSEQLHEILNNLKIISKISKRQMKAVILNDEQNIVRSQREKAELELHFQKLKEQQQLKALKEEARIDQMIKTMKLLHQQDILEIEKESLFLTNLEKEHKLNKDKKDDCCII